MQCWEHRYARSFLPVVPMPVSEGPLQLMLILASSGIEEIKFVGGPGTVMPCSFAGLDGDDCPTSLLADIRK